MHPELVRLFGCRVTGYGLAALLGAAAALILALRRARAAGVSARELLGAALPALLAGAVGARLAYMAQCGGSFFRGGFVLYGGLLAGVAAGLVACRGRLRVADLALPCVLVGVAFGRLGCFLGGCCFGIPAGWGASYPRGSFPFLDHAARGWIGAAAARSLPTVPAPLLEAFALLVLAAGLSQWGPRRPGAVTALAGLGYGAWRLIAEFWRGDNLPYWGPLTFSQGVSVAVIAASAALWARKAVDVSRVPRSPSLAQAAGVVAILIAGSGVLACAYPRERTMEMRGEVTLDARGNRIRSSGDGWGKLLGACVEVCAEACIEVCTEACVDACVDSCCDKEKDDDRRAPPPPLSPLALLIDQGRFSQGRAYGGRINLVATINQSCHAMIVFQGSAKAVEALPDQPASVVVDIESFDLRFDTLTLSGKGTLEARVGPNYQVTVTSSTLPKEILEALKGFDPLFGGGLILPAGVEANPAIRARLEKELGEPVVELELSGDFDLEDIHRRLDAEGKIERPEPGVYRISWRSR